MKSPPKANAHTMEREAPISLSPVNVIYIVRHKRLFRLNIVKRITLILGLDLCDHVAGRFTQATVERVQLALQFDHA